MTLATFQSALNPQIDGTGSTIKSRFNPDTADTAERRDQPVVVRLGTDDPDELRGGFPQTAAELYRYHAVILDEDHR